jgi:hypothetical protein
VADQFALSGSYSSSPLVGSPSGVASIPAPIDEQLVLTAKFYDTIMLGVDTPVSVPFNVGGVSNAAVVIIKVTGQKVKARFTSTDGIQQAVPIDTFFANISRTVPITAIDLTRTPGVSTRVDIFMGQVSP